ncbi:MAG: hypothetical protein R3C02_13975 [Planctomycetaceae bacterium]
MNLDTTSGCSSRSDHVASGRWRGLWTILALAAIVRVGALWVWSENLTEDRDVYLAIARGVVEGRGYSVQGTNVPTAFRPPLYPLLLVATGTSDSVWGRAFLHLVLGVATVWLTYLLGRRLGLCEPLALFAAGLVAVDPLLLRYTTFPMTETLATFLATALLLSLTMPTSRRLQFVTGAIFGLNVLCRPTLWVFAGLMGLWWLVRGWIAGEDRGSENHGRLRNVPWFTLAAVLIVVLPWVVRNALVMGHPILMTTHGGYTLLLGNNPSFYREVVDQPSGTVWDGSHGEGQEVWAASINRRLDEAGVAGEVARDGWMGQLAKQHIRNEPGEFVKACWLRFRRFWSLVPHGDADSSVSPMVRMPIGLFYGGVFLLALIGLGRVLIVDPARWCPLILLIVTFVSVHLVYWSNARMRSPVVPAVALLASRSLVSRRFVCD